MATGWGINGWNTGIWGGGTPFADSVTETVTIASVEAATVNLPVSVSDSLVTSTSESVAATFAFALTESIGTIGTTEVIKIDFVGQIAESMAIASSENSTIDYKVSILESLSALEINTVNAIFAFSNSETFAITNSQDAAYGLFRTETMATSTLEVVGTYFNSDRTESIATSTSETAITNYNDIVTETTAITTTEQVAATFVLSVSESASILDNSIALTTYTAVVIETNPIVTTQTVRYLWEPIDDTQTPNWQLINTTLDASWAPIVNVP